ncbi:MAG: hypothetical protein ACI9EW_003227 [Cellvibrionaceae bacterium]
MTTLKELFRYSNKLSWDSFCLIRENTIQKQL